MFFGNDRIPDGTTVAGVQLGGLTRDEAVDTLNSAFAKRQDFPMSIRGLESSTTISSSDFGLAIDVEGTADSVAPGGLFSALSRFGSGGAVAPVVTVDEKKMADQLNALAVSNDQQGSEPEITYEGTTPVVTPGEIGTLVDKAAAAELIKSSFLQSDAPIRLPVSSQSPQVSKEAADEVARTAAVKAVSEPVIFKAGDVTAQATPSDIASTLSFEERDGQLVPVIDGAELHTLLAAQLQAVDKPAKDAGWDVSSGTPVVKPAVDGSGVTDDNAFRDLVPPVLGNSGADRTVTLPLGPLKAKLTTEQAQAYGVVEKLSTFKQNFEPAAYRTQNIGTAAKRINNKFLAPGDTFSMNETILERTKANGYTEGYIVGAGDKLEMAMGGGVSTATTAVWTAAFYAGLERVEQRAHTIYISRYTPGLEATVAWGDLDLKFRNNTPMGVLITTKMTNSSITVTMWGTKQYDKVKAESGPKTNIVKPQLEKEVAGKGCVPLAGVEGFDISVDRVFYRGGQEVDRESLPTHYSPEPRVVCVPQAEVDKASAGATPSAAPSTAAGH